MFKVISHWSLGGRKRIIAVVVLVMVFGVCGGVNAMGGVPGGVRSTEHGARGTEQGAKSTEQKGKLKSQISNLKSQIPNPKSKQLGTPTVQQLLDKVKANYHKIQDLKADMYSVTKKEGGWGYPFFKDTHVANLKILFKAPDKLKYILDDEPESPTIIKNQTHYRKVNNEDWIYRLPWYLMLDPDRFDFYWRLDEIILKFDTKVISHPETDIWVIEAVPKASNPEDRYNYPLPRVGLEIYIDYEKGVMTKIVDFDAKTGEKDTPWCEIKDFKLIGNIWIPIKFIKTTEVKEEITLSNIQINTGISDSEFEF